MNCIEWIEVLQKLDIADAFSPLIYVTERDRGAARQIRSAVKQTKGDVRVWLQRKEV